MREGGKWYYLTMGFVTGMVFLVACGGGSGPAAVANYVYAAAQISFSNTDSELTAEHVQGALDEVSTTLEFLNNRVTALETKAREIVEPFDVAFSPDTLFEFHDIPGFELEVETGACDLLIRVELYLTDNPNIMEHYENEHGAIRVVVGDDEHIATTHAFLLELGRRVSLTHIVEGLSAGTHTIKVQASLTHDEDGYPQYFNSPRLMAIEL